MSVTLNNTLVFVLTDIAPAMVFLDSDDYENGVTYTAAAGGSVTCTAPFSVDVKSDGDLTSGANTIAIGSISVQATGTDLGTTNAVDISTTDQAVISAAPAGLTKLFGLTYSTTGGDSEFIGKPTGAYTATLTYTASID